MKKFLICILTMVYMLVSSGIAMEIHYCMGKKAAVEFYGSDHENCGKCGMTEKKGGCCTDEHKFYKIDDSHKNVSNDIKFTAVDIAVVTAFPIYHFQQPIIVAPITINNYFPPEDTGPSLRILNCVFRI